jgi:hypothetical protein
MLLTEHSPLQDISWGIQSTWSISVEAVATTKLLLRPSLDCMNGVSMFFICNIKRTLMCSEKHPQWSSMLTWWSWILFNAVSKQSKFECAHSIFQLIYPLKVRMNQREGSEVDARKLDMRQLQRQGLHDVRTTLQSLRGIMLLEYGWVPPWIIAARLLIKCNQEKVLGIQ